MQKKSRNVNEDEHAVSFYSMPILVEYHLFQIVLIWINLTDIKAIFNMQAQGKLDANFNPIGGMNDNDKYYYKEFMDNLRSIQDSGGDVGLTTRTYTFSNDLYSMGLSNNDKARFLSNKQKLNFFGLWPSFCYLNQ